MYKGLNYILLMLLMFVVLMATGGPVVIDKVCLDAVRTYRVNKGAGDPIQDYNWILKNESGVSFSIPSGSNFTDTDATGNLIEGNEITIPWSFGVGTYTLSVEKQSIFGCSVEELGNIEVMPKPVVDAGPDQVICVDVTTVVGLSAAKVIDITGNGIEWTSGGDGSFDNPNAVNPIYTPGAGDLLAGKVTLKLTAKSFTDDSDGCIQEDEIEILLSPKPVLIITNPKAVCEPDAVDLTAASVTVGSTKPVGVEPTYWMDAATTIALANPNHVIVSGTYYVKLGDNVNCQDIQPVMVTINKQPNLVIKDPLAVCEPSTVNLAASYITAGSDPGLTLSYWNDASATSPLANYNAVSSNGTFYIKAVIGAECSSSIKPVTVSIIQKSTPQFNILNLLCQNSTPPDLPTISTDNIAGSWNPSVISTSSLGVASYVFTPNPGECALPTSVNITITDNIVPTFAAIGPFCVGESPTPLPLTSTNGIKGTWNPATISTATSGSNNYIFTPDPDPGQCANPITIPILVTSPVMPTFDPIDPICQNAANPLPGKSVEGIPGSWSPAFSSATEGLTTYTFTPNNSYCFKPTTVDVVVNPPIVISETHVNLDYSVSPIGSIDITVSGGSGNFSYSWSNGAITEDLSNLAAGTYTVTVVDNITKCQEPKTIILTSFIIPLTVTTKNTLETCPGSGDATATAIPSGGTPPYISFKWDNGQTGQTASGLTAGIYNVTVIDSDGASASASVLIPNAASTFGFDPKINQPCWGEKGSIEFFFTNVPNDLGLIDIYYDGGKFADVKIVDNYVKVDNVEVGTYNDVRVQINGCWSQSISLTVKYPEYTLSAVGIDPVCEGKDGIIQLNFTYVLDGIYEVLHDNGSFGMVEVKGGRAEVPASSGTYQYLKVMIDPCPISFGTPIVINNALPLTLDATVKQPDCDIPTGTITVNTPVPTAGMIYTVTGTNPVTPPDSNASGVFAGLAPGIYNVTVTNSFGCTTAPIVKTIDPHSATPANPTALPVAPMCEDVPIQTLNANNYIVAPPAGVVIVWYDAAVGGNVIAQPILNSAQTVTYYAEATNGECSSPGRTPISMTIIPRPGSPVSMGDLSACESTPLVTLDARNAIDPASIINLRWFTAPTGGTPVSNPVLSSVGSVTYFVENDGGTCSSSPRIPVKLTIYRNPAAPQLNLTEVPKCSDSFGIVDVISPIGPEYVYSVDNGPFESATRFNMLPGSHRVKAKNTITGCLSPESGIIIPDIPPQPHITNLTVENCICYGDLGKLNFEFENVADGTYVIVYIGGEFNNVEVLNGKASILVAAGKYEVLAIKANGCTSPESWTKEVTQPNKLSISAKITEIDLKSGQKGEIDLTISGGSGLYTTVWEPNLTSGFAGATSEDIKDLSNGDYIVNVTDEKGCIEKAMLTIPLPNMPPIATNDEFDANCNSITGDLLYTDNGSGIDSDPDNDPIEIDVVPLKLPSYGTLTINPDGTFVFSAVRGYIGDDTFIYRIYDVKKNYSNPAVVTIHIAADSDGDGIIDNLDPDADGDGILNVNEILSGQDWKVTDADGDGNPNYLDIDSDGDGILDYTETQPSSGYLIPKGTDTDKDGVDDAYDPDNGGTTLIPINTDLDSSTGGDDLPDFLDTDSDDDLVPDYIEGHDVNADGKPDVVMSGKDFDADGLDDVYDSLANDCSIDNAFAGNAAVQDFDLDGKRDWRDENDDDDEYLTRFEDLNMDGDFSNDDTDFDGRPEYLDYGRDCDLFVPDAFSPNNDNIHDYFMVYCINHFPNAQMFIFDQNGNKLFEKNNYGNLAVWGTPDRAWWDGRTTVRGIITNNGKVIPGTYYYVLKLGNGDVRKSFVFVSY